MGGRHLRVLAAIPDRFEVMGGFDIRPDAAIPAGLRRFESEAEAIGRADLVVIATPIGEHARSASHALGAGRHVFVEKPLCATTSEARALMSAASGAACLFVGHSERFNPVVRALARMARDEDVARAIDFCRVGPSKVLDAGVLLNLGVHDLDLAGYLGKGEPMLVGAVGARVTPGRGEDFAHVLLRLTSGALAHIALDRTVPTKKRTVVFSSHLWTYEGDLLSHRLVRTARSTGVSTDVPLPLEEPLFTQAQSLADAIDGGAVREIATLAEGARAVQLAEEAAASCLSWAASESSSNAGGVPR
jgi:virulence factor